MNASPMVGNALRPIEQRALDAVRAGHVELFRYDGFHDTPSTCNLVSIVDKDNAVVIFAQTNGHRGTSITNNFEQLATKLFGEQLYFQGVKPNNISWFQHYDESVSLNGKESLDRVELEHTGGGQRVRFFSPTWHRVSL